MYRSIIKKPTNGAGYIIRSDTNYGDNHSVTPLCGSLIMGSTSVAEDSIFATSLTKLALLMHFSVVGQFSGDLTNALVI